MAVGFTRPPLLSWPALRVALRSHLPGRRCSDPPGGSDSARYCYAVWMRHLILASQRTGGRLPRAVGKLGPGDSIGVGLAALVTGATRYLAFDVVPHARHARNRLNLEELVGLFRERAPFPSDGELPNLKPRLSAHRFPADLLSDQHLRDTLAPARIDSLRANLEAPGEGGAITYIAPWFDASLVRPGALDLVFAQAAMEHVDALAQAYATRFRWLGPGGLMSHQIRGNQPYLTNRQPHSTHAAMIKEAGFNTRLELPVPATSRLRRGDLARRAGHLTNADLETSGAFILAVRPPEASPSPTHVQR